MKNNRRRGNRKGKGEWEDRKYKGKKRKARKKHKGKREKIIGEIGKL